MQLRVLYLLPDVGADDLDLGLGVPEATGEEGVGESFEALHDLEIIPGADFFLLFFAMPGSTTMPGVYAWPAKRGGGGAPGRGPQVLTRCLSLVHVPTGKTNFSACTP